MGHIVTAFLCCEDGSAIFDWKIMSAILAAVGLGIGAHTFDGSHVVSNGVGAALSDDNLPAQIFPGYTGNQ